MRMMPMAIALVLLAVPATAFEFEFTGTVSMGVVGASTAQGSGASPFVGVDAEATLSFDLGDDGVTVGIIVPLDAEIYDDSFLPAYR